MNDATGLPWIETAYDGLGTVPYAYWIYQPASHAGVLHFVTPAMLTDAATVAAMIPADRPMTQPELDAFFAMISARFAPVPEAIPCTTKYGCTSHPDPEFPPTASPLPYEACIKRCDDNFWAIGGMACGLLFFRNPPAAALCVATVTAGGFMCEGGCRPPPPDNAAELIWCDEGQFTPLILYADHCAKDPATVMQRACTRTDSRLIADPMTAQGLYEFWSYCRDPAHPVDHTPPHTVTGKVLCTNGVLTDAQFNYDHFGDPAYACRAH